MYRTINYRCMGKSYSSKYSKKIACFSSSVMVEHCLPYLLHTSELQPFLSFQAGMIFGCLGTDILLPNVSLSSGVHLLVASLMFRHLERRLPWILTIYTCQAQTLDLYLSLHIVLTQGCIQKQSHVFKISSRMPLRSQLAIRWLCQYIIPEQVSKRDQLCQWNLSWWMSNFYMRSFCFLERAGRLESKTIPSVPFILWLLLCV